MTDVATPSPASSTWVRPRVILPLIALLFVGVVLLGPRPDEEPSMEWHLTTFSSGQLAARGVYEVLTRLGWHTSRRETPFMGTLDHDAVYVTLAPPIPLSDAEDSTLLHFVQQGGRLIVVSRDSAFTAMFGMWPTLHPLPGGYHGEISVAGDDGDVASKQESVTDWLGTTHTIQTSIVGAVRIAPSVHDTLAYFIWASEIDSDSSTAPPIMVGRRLGKGRVVLLAEPSLLTNMVARDRPSILGMQRALEWLAPPNGSVVFDEYHHGYGVHQQSVFTVIIDALTDTAPGRVTLQVVAAALILLLAIGVRPILPVPITTIQRRSPLEHVDALARAYGAIHATQLGAQRLVRGLRRRHPMGTVRARAADDPAAYLSVIQARYKIPAQDIDTILAATDHPESDARFLQAGQAIGRIEETIHTGTR